MSKFTSSIATDDWCTDARFSHFIVYTMISFHFISAEPNRFFSWRDNTFPRKYTIHRRRLWCVGVMRLWCRLAHFYPSSFCFILLLYRRWFREAITYAKRTLYFNCTISSGGFDVKWFLPTSIVFIMLDIWRGVRFVCFFLFCFIVSSLNVLQKSHSTSLFRYELMVIIKCGFHLLLYRLMMLETFPFFHSFHNANALAASNGTSSEFMRLCTWCGFIVQSDRSQYLLIFTDIYW